MVLSACLGKVPLFAASTNSTAQELDLDSLKLAEGDSPLTQRIQVLESRLAGAVERLDEVIAQRKTLEQISKRLRDERTGLDPQVRSALWEVPGVRLTHFFTPVASAGAHACCQNSRPGGDDPSEP